MSKLVFRCWNRWGFVYHLKHSHAAFWHCIDPVPINLKRSLCGKTHKNHSSISCKHSIFLVPLQTSVPTSYFSKWICTVTAQKQNQVMEISMLIPYNICTPDFTGAVFFLFPYPFFSISFPSLKYSIGENSKIKYLRVNTLKASRN